MAWHFRELVALDQNPFSPNVNIWVTGHATTRASSSSTVYFIYFLS